MTRFFTAAFGTLLGIAPLYAAVDPALLSLVMPDATAVAGVQVDQSQASPFGRFLLSQVKADTARDQLLAATGFDPLRDLREIVVATNAAKGGLALGRGVFQPGNLTALAVQQGGKVTRYKGVDIVSEPGGKGGFAFLDASIVAIGQIDMLQAVVDRRSSGGLFTGDLAQKAKDVSGAGDAWVVGTAPSMLPGGIVPSGNARILQSIRQFSGAVKFGSTVSVSADAVTATPQDAQSLADALQFLVAIAQDKGDGKANPILATAKFSASGSTAHISLDVPEEQLEQLLTPPKKHLEPRRREVR